MLRKPVHVVGAGGIGVTVAWCLSRTISGITVVETNPRKLEHSRRHGLTVEGVGTAFLPFVSFEDWVPPDDGHVLLCTKTYDNPAVLQNGVDAHLEALGHAGEGIASYVSNCEPERPVARMTRAGCLHIGMRRPGTAGERAELAMLALALDQAKLFDVKLVDDIRELCGNLGDAWLQAAR